MRSNGTKELSYLHQDHLGSLDVISNNQGQKTECLSFDAFGKRRQCSGWNPVTNAFAEISLGTILAITPRGFTGHEHIDHAEVIHMNGRIYDPKNGRFMQADPIVQAPDHSQSPNRYSYVFNNPLSYTDPTGFEAYVLNPWSDWLPVNGDWLSTMYRLAPATTRLEMKKYKKLDGAYGNHTPVDSNTEDGAANKVDSQQTGPTEVSDVHLGDGTINEIDGPYSKPQVTAPHKQILAKGESRRLTTDEIKLAMKILELQLIIQRQKYLEKKPTFSSLSIGQWRLMEIFIFILTLTIIMMIIHLLEQQYNTHLSMNWYTSGNTSME